MKALKLKKLIFISFISLSIFASCKHELTGTKPQFAESDSASGTIAAVDEQNDTAELSIQLYNAKSARTVNPSNYNPEGFSDFVLTGKLSGTTQETELFSAESFDKINGTTIALKCGTWELTLSAKFNGILFTDSKTVVIKHTKQNRVSFTLKPAEHFGGYKITYDFNGDSTNNIAPTEIKRVEAVLKKADGTGTETLYTLNETQITAANNKAIFSRSVTDPAERLESGSYSFFVKFYADPNDPTPINTREDILCIQDGLMSKAEINLNFNEIYEIEFLTEDDSPITEFSGEGFAISRYSVRSHFNLPSVEVSGKIFAGWKNKNTNSIISEVSVGTSGNLALVPELHDPVLYVSGNGDDSNTGWAAGNDSAFETVNKACEAIMALGSPEIDWTIKICGNVTGPHTSNRKQSDRVDSSTGADTGYSSDYGRSIIPDTLTTEHAKSILLIGNTNLGANEMPQDKINRGLDGHNRDGSKTGVNLVVATSVPVTINNLLLVNGNNAYPNNSSDIYDLKGGGLLVTSDATVTLGNGVVIKDNRAKEGGGVYNAGTLCIYGTALIGDRSATSAATGYASGQGSNTTSGDGGGGIYNTGKLYLGYSDANTPAAWDTEKGGIFYNYAYWDYAGAIYNALSGEVFFKSGIIKYNASTFTAGAIYNLGTFTMEGGTIENNQAGSSGGGGFYNENINGKGSGTFIFAGGSIKSNKATGSGGGIYNKGTLLIYGSAVIGKADATSIATSQTDCSNYAEGSGGGIFVDSTGLCYLGYSGYTDASQNTPMTWSGGIYYNYSNKGAGIYAGGTVVMNSGTIKYNAATIEKSNAVYLNNSNFTLGGTAVIPAANGKTEPADSDKINDIFYASSHILKINGSLEELNDGDICLIPDGSTTGSNPGYYTSDPVIALTAAAQDANISLATVIPKFYVAPFVNTESGQTTHWLIDETSGKLKIKTSSGISASVDTGTSDLVVYRNGYVINEGSLITVNNSTSIVTLRVQSVNGKTSFGKTNPITYEWAYDGEVLTNGETMPAGVSFSSTSDERQLNINTSTMDYGIHDIWLEVYFGYEFYSFNCQIKK